MLICINNSNSLRDNDGLTNTCCWPVFLMTYSPISEICGAGVFLSFTVNADVVVDSVGRMAPAHPEEPWPGKLLPCGWGKEGPATAPTSSEMALVTCCFVLPGINLGPLLETAKSITVDVDEG